MIAVGDRAPNFTLPGTEGDEIVPYELTDHTRSGAVVLVFYPFDFSPVCTEELCAFRDAEWLTFTDDVDVFGVSLDSCYAHEWFIDAYNLNFPLLSDTTGAVTAEYGLAYDEWEHHPGVPKRSLVTVDDSRTVRYLWVTESAYESPSTDELEQTVRTLSADL